MRNSGTIVVGVDVGGKKKGFHAVALRGGKYWQKCPDATSAASVAAWCVDIHASAVGVDAPCAWSKTGRARQAERELMGEGVWCFATPTHEVAVRHPTAYYHWMLSGAALFDSLKAHYRLLDENMLVNEPVCFEAFPHAITCALLGRIASAKQKRADRRGILKSAGIDTSDLANIDLLDAALCALTAHHLLAGNFKAYGDATEGFIVVPDSALD